MFPIHTEITYVNSDTLKYSRVPNNSQDLIGVWVRSFYDNLNVNDPIIVHFLTALKSYKWGVLNKSQLNTTYSEKRFLKVTYYIIEWSNHSYIHMKVLYSWYCFFKSFANIWFKLKWKPLLKNFWFVSSLLYMTNTLRKGISGVNPIIVRGWKEVFIISGVYN